ncbi:MAG: hypothetical protein CBB79_05505 [Synechococcus sp. TMED19]|nr:MAG: hypothetical protein CBB79_05505 [Synechococcus sp. TMED19]
MGSTGPSHDWRFGLTQAVADGDLNLQAKLYRQALAEAPGNHRLWVNYGDVHWLQGNVAESLVAFRRACSLSPDAVLAWRGLAHALRDGRQYRAALEALSKARALQDSPLLAWSASQLLLGLERYGEAYALAERRLNHPELELYRTPQPPPVLLRDASPASASTSELVVFSEQGFGDTLQYLRWLVPLLNRGWRVQLELEPALVSLVVEGMAWLGSAADRLQVWPRQPAAPPLTQQPAAVLSLLSLPYQLGGAPAADFFRSQRQGQWLGYLRHQLWMPPPPRSQPRIGLLWASGRKEDDAFLAREYRQRSLPAEALGALLLGLQSQGAELVSLQLGPDRQRAGPWQQLVSEQLAEGSDFLATAAAVRRLDLVITVDTAMAHLCGAIGQQAWVLLPFAADPRWLRGRSQSAWYPSLRLWRQPEPHQWKPVIEKLLAALPGWWQQQRLS